MRRGKEFWEFLDYSVTELFFGLVFLRYFISSAWNNLWLVFVVRKFYILSVCLLCLLKGTLVASYSKEKKKNKS